MKRIFIINILEKFGVDSIHIFRVTINLKSGFFPLCMNFTKVEHVFAGSAWKRYKNFPIDGANEDGVKNGRFLLFAQNILT